jgi:hypothetical protein
MPCSCPDDNVAVVMAHAGEPGHLADVDHQRRGGETQLEQRDQALASGKDLGLVAMLGERAQNLV